MGPPSYCVLGAAGDTGNLGVSALMEATLAGLADAAPGSRLTVFDNSWGSDDLVLTAGTRAVPYTRRGIRRSRRLHRPESLYNMRLAAHARWLRNAGVDALRDAGAAFDLSGGDSFADIYGLPRFRAMAEQKELVVRLRTPLVLLPQTYGPYADDGVRRRARDILRRSAAVWARDEDSLAVAAGLLGPDFDPARHRLGVDVAMALPARVPASPAGSELAGWLEKTRTPVVGLNVSGLLYNDPASTARFGLRDEYRAVVHHILDEFLTGTDARVLLTPHVLAPPGKPESDSAACDALVARMPRGQRDRVESVSGITEPQEMKWVIGHCDFFCGTRMHSTIAALSSRVPAAALAYSAKTRGVFATCGQEGRVGDLRRDTIDDVVGTVWSAWDERAAIRRDLDQTMPGVEVLAREPFRQALPAPTRTG